MRIRMRTLKVKLRPSFPSCIHRKVSDERPKRALLEMGDFPLHILESRRRERIEELKAECLELKHQLSEHSLPAAVLREEAQLNNASNSKQTRALSGRHSKSMHELRRGPGKKGSNNNTLSKAPSEETMRRMREERLENLRRELEQFAIKYSIGEYAEKIDGLDNGTPLRKAASENLVGSPISSTPTPWKSQSPLDSQLEGVDVANAGILLRIQKNRELELQRARMELKHLAFRLKHKLDEENNSLKDGMS